MGNFFQLLEGPVFAGQSVMLGFSKPGLPELRIPQTIRQSATYQDLGVEIELCCELVNSRLEIREIKILAKNGVLATSLFTQLKLPQVLRKIGLSTISNSDFFMRELRRETSDKYVNDALIAQIYALEYACWGGPRDTIMKYMGWSRTNTNLHLRRISRAFPLPGPQRLPEQRGSRSRNETLAGNG